MNPLFHIPNCWACFSITKPVSARVMKVMSSILSPNQFVTRDIRNYTNCWYVRCSILIWEGGIPWHKTGITYYHTHLRLPDKDRANKGLVDWNGWYLEQLYLQPSQEVLNYHYITFFLKIGLENMNANKLNFKNLNW